MPVHARATGAVRPADLQGAARGGHRRGYCRRCGATAPTALAPLKQFGEPAADLIGPMTYVDFRRITDAGNPPGRRNYWRSEMLPEAPDEAIDAFIACAARRHLARQRR